MGFFSWRRAHTGLPIMANARSERSIPGQFNASRVTVLYQAGIRTEGIYDGYGRLATPDGQAFNLQEEIDRHDARLVLSDLCREELKVKPGDLTRPSRFWDTLQLHGGKPTIKAVLMRDLLQRGVVGGIAALDALFSLALHGRQLRGGNRCAHLGHPEAPMDSPLAPRRSRG
jgi:hypothetical protein